MAVKDRFLAIECNVAETDLRLRSFTGSEELSRLFQFNLDLVCPSGDLKSADITSKLIGKEVSLRVDLAEGERRFNGHISQIAADYSEDLGTVYRATMVPWLWFLTQTSDCRIFHDMSIPDIIEKVLNESAIKGPIELKGLGSYSPLEYCVQYRETDFNFVSRLMEQAGLFYYFVHEDSGQAKLVIGDSTSAYYDLPEKTVEYPPSSSAAGTFTDHIRSWQRDYQFVSGKVVHTDYNFKDPHTSLESSADTTLSQSDLKDYEIFDFPGEFFQKSDGDHEAEVRVQEEEVGFDQMRGTSTCRTFSSGGKFTFGTYKPSDNESGDFLITSIQHLAQDPAQVGGGGTAEYGNSFTCIKADATFRPARITPKPVISGLQSAVVVGKDNEEIDCDKYGRVLVKFHWARDGESRGEQVSCRVRVALGVAGKKWGFQAIPRIGQEVMVDFLEGDPDRPVIVGGVYNEVQFPHYELPEHAAKTFIKTNSTKGGEGFNELMFDDRADQERVFVHGQKDMDVRVRNDSRERILHDRHQIIGHEKDGAKVGDQKEMVYQDKHQNVKRHQFEQIEGNYTLTVGHGDADDGGNVAVNVEKNTAVVVGSDGMSLTNQGNMLTQVDGSVSNTITGDLKEQAGSVSMTCLGDHNESAMNYSMESDMAVHVKGGMTVAVEAGMEVHIKAGMSLVLEADVAVSLKVGGNFITINPAGVFIQGTMLMLNSGGAAMSGAGCSPQAPQSPESPTAGTMADERPVEPDQAHEEQSGFKSAPD